MGDDASDDYVNSEANYLPDVDITERSLPAPPGAEFLRRQVW